MGLELRKFGSRALTTPFVQHPSSVFQAGCLLKFSCRLGKDYLCEQPVRKEKVGEAHGVETLMRIEESHLHFNIHTGNRSVRLGCLTSHTHRHTHTLLTKSAEPYSPPTGILGIKQNKAVIKMLLPRLCCLGPFQPGTQDNVSPSLAWPHACRPHPSQCPAVLSLPCLWQ